MKNQHWRKEILRILNQNPFFYKSPGWEKKLPPEDFTFYKEFIGGMIRHYGTLSHLVEFFGKKKKFLEQEVFLALLLGYYQILFCEEIPLYASLSETVEAIKIRKGKKRASFVNALLRNLERGIDKRVEESLENPGALPLGEKGTLLFKKNPFPDPQTEPLKYLSLAYSYPFWLVERFSKELGPEKTLRVLRAGNGSHPLFGRLNLLKGSLVDLKEQLRQEEIPFLETPSEEVIRFSTGPSIEDFKPFQEGKIYFQDLNAVRILSGWKIKPSKILDLCAAPGGKLSCLAALFPEAEITGLDLTGKRMAKTRKNLERLGVKARLIEGNAREISRDQLGVFDLVLVDVPCSNTGVLRKRFEARWRVSPEDMANLAELQQTLLKKAGEVLSEKGALLYSTCSILREENHQRVRDFLSRNSSLALSGEKIFLPGDGEGDGAYGALLRKVSLFP